jgi:hypothetical protein
MRRTLGALFAAVPAAGLVIGVGQAAHAANDPQPGT